MAGQLDFSWLGAIKAALVLYCGDYRYKNGAFATAVTETTSTVDDLNIIINSPLLASHEKKAFEQIKNAVISVRNRKARGEKLNEFRLLMEAHEPTKAMEKVISADMKLRGQYEPPPNMIQIQDQDGTTEETILIDEDGKATRYKGGQPGIVPGAPQAFNEAQQKAFGDKFGPKKKDNRDHGAGGPMRSKEAHTNSQQKTQVPGSSSKPEGASVGSSSGKVKTDLPTSKKSTGFAGFGKGFEGNLKNAFL